MDYGLEAVMLIAADIQAADHTTISANADVVSIPANIDANLTAAGVTQTKAALEAINIPAEWVTTALTYRQVLKQVAKVFQFFQRLHGLGAGQVFTGGVNADTVFSSLPQAAKLSLSAAADSFGFDKTTVSGSSTLRQIFKAMADQFSGSINFGGAL